MHDGVVEVGIEGLAQGGNLRDAQLSQDLPELSHGHLYALFEGLVGGLLLQGPFQIVVDGKEGGEGVGLGVGVDALLFLLAALAEVVVLGGQPEVLLLLGRQGSFQMLQLLRQRVLGSGGGLLRNDILRDLGALRVL